MALARINLVFQDDNGDLVDGASVEVRNEETLALAPVFSDRAGSSSLGNPFTAADGADAGFYVAGGAYKITATLGAFSKIIRHQAAGTMAEHDFADVEGNLAGGYATRTAAIAADLSEYAVGERISTLAYATAGDGGGGIYERVASLGSGTGYFTAADGSFWGLVGPVINILQFGAVADPAANGTNDSTTPINNAISFVNANASISTLVFGRGEVYTVTAQLTAFTRSVDITGATGTSAVPSAINKRFVEASSTRGILSFGQYGPRISRLQILGTSGSGGSLIDFINPTDTANVGVIYLEDLWLSSNGFANYGLYVDGTANDVAPLGARNIFITNVQIFGAATWAVKLLGVRQFLAANSIFDTSGGSANCLWLTGTGSVTSNNFDFDGVVTNATIDNTDGAIFFGTIGTLTLDNINNVQVHGAVLGNITNTSSCTNCRIFGYVTGTVENDWNYTNQIIDGSAGRANNLSFRASVNFNSANTDTTIPIVIPAGFSRYRIERVTVSGASASITTATAGLFTQAAAGGTAIVTAASAMTVSTASEGTTSNMQVMSLNGQNTTSYNLSSLFWRVATAQGSAATATVMVTINPVS